MCYRMNTVYDKAPISPEVVNLEKNELREGTAVYAATLALAFARVRVALPIGSEPSQKQHRVLAQLHHALLRPIPYLHHVRPHPVQ